MDGNCGAEAVYNITVEQAGLFYADGVLASNTDQEDHIYDEACHPCMANPIALSDEAIVERVRHEEAMAKRSQLDRPSQIASAEVDRVMERIKRRERDIGDTDSGEERVW